VFTLSLVAVCVLLAVSVGLSWPTNVLSDQSQDAQRVRQELTLPLPQGWAFFTRSPQEPSLTIYREDAAGNEVRADDLPQSRVQNIFGWSRNQRAETTELAIVAQDVQFTDCEDYLSVCLAASAPSRQTVVNSTNTRHFCGDYRVVVQYPVKWLYRHQTPEDTRASQFAEVSLSCG
jgi:antimicrobial peptide system SdpA family protein